MKVIKRVVARQYKKTKNKNFWTDVGVVIEEDRRQTLIRGSRSIRGKSNAKR